MKLSLGLTQPKS